MPAKLTGLLFFLFGLRTDFHALDVDLVLFASSHHLALSIVTIAARTEIFLVKDKVLFVTV